MLHLQVWAPKASMCYYLRPLPFCIPESCGEAPASRGNLLWTFHEREISYRGMFVTAAGAILASTNTQPQFSRRPSFFIVVFIDFPEYSLIEFLAGPICACFSVFALNV